MRSRQAPAPSCRLRLATAVNTTAAQGTNLIALDAVDWDTDRMAAPATAGAFNVAGKIIIRTPGLYTISGHALISTANGGKQRQVSAVLVRAGGAAVTVGPLIMPLGATAGNPSAQGGTVTETLRCGAGDAIDLRIYQDSAGNESVGVAALSATWVGP